MDQHIQDMLNAKLINGDEADRCLMTMCTSCTQARVLSTLMSASSNRVPVVRAKAACHIGYCVSKLGSDVCTLRELNRLVNVGVKFMGEPVQDARHAGRRLLYSLYTHGAVELRQLQRLLQEREYRQLLELVQRGGPPPTDNVDFLVRSRVWARLHYSFIYITSLSEIIQIG